MYQRCFYDLVSISLPIIIIILYSEFWRMNRQEHQIFTHDHSHHGVNSIEVLNEYLNYASISRDPHNIFRFMEEKAICTFLPAFWLAKAKYLAQKGDYSACFQSIQLALYNTDQDQAQIMVTITQTQLEFRRKLIDDIRQFPISSKRSASQFNFQECLGAGKVGKSKQAELLKIYEQKYKALREQKQRRAFARLDKLPLSWLSAYYQKENQVQKMIQQKIYQSSLRGSRDIKYYSMHTPIRAKNLQRLTKTMDSVQMLKKKRSTRQKDKSSGKSKGYDSQEEENYSTEKSSKMINSLPVGQKFTKLKRRVTFQHESFTKKQKNRCQSKNAESFEKLLITQNQERKVQKMQEQENQQVQIHSQPISKQ